MTVRRGAITRDLLWTTLTSSAVLLGNVLLASLLARRGAVDVFEPYNLAKRMGAALLPFVSLGLTVGLVRHIAAEKGIRDRAEYSVAAITMVASMLLAGTALIFVLPELTSRLLVGTSDTGLSWAVWGYTVALSTNALVYAFYRAELRQTFANWTNLVAMAAIPLAIVAVAPYSWSVERILWSVAGLILAWNGTQLLIRFARSVSTGLTSDGLRRQGWRMLSYSLPRIPAGLAAGLLLAVGPLIARSRGALETSTYVLAGLAVAQMANAALQAFGIVLLPRVSEMDAEGDIERIRAVAERLMLGGLILAAASAPVLVGIVPKVLPVWLGEEFVGAVTTVQVVSVALPAVVIYNLLRSVADGSIRQPVNTYAALAGLGVGTLIMYFVSAEQAEMIAVGFVAGEWVMAIGVFIAIRRHLHTRLAAIPVLAAGGASCVLGYAVDRIDLGGGLGVLAVLSVAVLGVFGILALALWFSPERFGFRHALRRLGVSFR